MTREQQTLARLSELLVIDVSELPAAPPPQDADIDHRTQDEIHACIRCGQPARVAFVLGPIAGLGCRWMDLCPECAEQVRSFADQEGEER